MKLEKLALLAVVCLAAFCFGCASTDPSNQPVRDLKGHIKAGDSTAISIGMSKQEVLQKLGRPETISAASDGTETLNYLLERPWWQDRPFRIKLVDGKVESFEVVEKPAPPK